MYNVDVIKYDYTDFLVNWTDKLLKIYENPSYSSGHDSLLCGTTINRTKACSWPLQDEMINTHHDMKVLDGIKPHQ